MFNRLTLAAVVSLIGLLSTCGSTIGATVNLEAAKDNTLYEDTGGALSNSAGPGLFVGQTGRGRVVRGLIMFDVAAEIPASATITSASLTLEVTRVRNGAPTDPPSINLSRLSQDWGEEASMAVGGGGGGGGGGPALPGDATWTHRFTDTETWTSPGGDFLSLVSASQEVSDLGAYQWSSEQLILDIQAMLDTPNDNFGWILRGNEINPDDVKRFGSRESVSPPRLTIDYDLAGGFNSDFDGDNDVDGDDLDDWIMAFNAGDGGDADGDSDSDGADFLIWQKEFTGPLSMPTAAVPEPATALLALALLPLGIRNGRGSAPRS